MWNFQLSFQGKQIPYFPIWSSIPHLIVGVFSFLFAGFIYAQAPYWHSLHKLPLTGVEVTQLVPSTIQDSLMYGIGSQDGTSVVFHTSDLGQTWTIHPVQELSEVHALAVQFHPHKADTLYIAGTPGLFRSTDMGEHWTQLAGDVGDHTYIALAVQGVTLLAGTADPAPAENGVLVSHDGGRSFQFHSVSQEIVQHFTSIQIAPDKPTVVFAVGDSSRGILRSLDVGLHWQSITTPWTDPLSIADLFIPEEGELGERTVSERVMSAMTSGEIFASDDWGDSWYQLEKPNTLFVPLDVGTVPNQTVHFIQHPRLPWVMYIGTEEDGLWGTREADRFRPQHPAWETLRFRTSAITANGHHLLFGSEQGIHLFNLQVNPSHRDWERFYPLQVGNLWVYTYDDYGRQWTVRKRVVGDTTFNGESDWKILKYDEDDEREYARIDEEGNVFRKDHDVGAPYWWSRFNDVAWGDTMPYGPLNDREEYFWEVLMIDTMDVVATSDSFDIRITYYQDYLTYHYLQIQEHLGVAYERWEGGIFAQLRGAYIDGVLYGDTTRAVPVTDEPNATPMAVRLEPNYPNPFNSSTTLSYSAEVTHHVRLCIYDISGHHITTVVDRANPPGMYTYQWNGTDLQGREVPSGLYLYTLYISGNRVATRKMMKMK